MVKTVSQWEQGYIDDLNALPDWMSKYQYLLRIAALAEPFPEAYRDEAHRVKGCQANTWLVCREDVGRVFFRADSEALLVRGILCILAETLSDRAPGETAEAELQLLHATGLDRHLPESRANGIKAACRTMQRFAEALC